MSKKSAIDKANRRLLNESIPPMIYFNEFEVAQILSDAIGCDNLNLPPMAVKALQTALIKKGRNLNPPNVPDGAMM